MAVTYFTLLTKIGQAKIANAIALGDDVAWTHMAVGDGNGNPTTPNENQTALIRENYRALINQLTVDPDNPNYMVAEMIVPTTVGGWAVNEVGIFDEDGDLIAVANFPATYKPQLAEGSGRDLVVRIIIQVSNASVVTLKIDPAIVLASQKWVVDNYVKKITVAGGTTGQVLAKTSNADEDFEWIDRDTAENIVVDAKTERQTLAADQVIVNLVTLTTEAIAPYVEGARLIETIDYTVNTATRFTMAHSYPAGSRIHMYQNDPTSTISDATETLRGFTTLATAAETIAGTINSKSVHPAGLAAAISGIGAAVVGAFSNLKASATGTSAPVTITADELIVKGSAGYKSLSAVNLSVSLAASGANGLDAGASAASIWYALWVIWNGTTAAGLLSLSETAPTMPAGYTHKARVGWIKSDGTANKYPLAFKQFGRKVSYAVGGNVTGMRVIANAPGPKVAVSWSAAAPPTSAALDVVMTSSPGATCSCAPNPNYGATDSAINPPPMVASLTDAYVVMSKVMIPESTNIYCQGTTNAVFFIAGWEDNL